MAWPAVLFDLGNVLVRLNFERGLARLQALAGPRAPANAELAKIFLSPASLACNKGELSPAAFLDHLSHQLGLEAVPRASLSEAWCAIFDPYPEMEALADEVLNLGHPAILASNTDPLHFAFLKPRIPVLSRFTGHHLSYEAGAVKPDLAFFRAALSRFSLAPERCAFLDDRPDHVAAAQGLGIASHLHDFASGAKGVEAARAFLRGRGVAVK